ncbi:alpha/beta hydrolase fold domain-containing protein [Paludisphaera rhizosphaerae]|uniref:alpha/beta hydrolase fold domain-containing protein n=1 Tax=Paludisphaera rhizosphaerae TaxID=2711216 RepID=UPI0013EA3207|nr:alpha/beta hydrolase fold domain-containing protein [Paludisphaera rhizosphaerae]
MFRTLRQFAPGAIALSLALLPLAGDVLARLRDRLAAAAAVSRRPDRGNLRYGPFDRNVLDLWLPSGPAVGPPELAPVVVFFHGGGFMGGDKSSVPAWLIRRCRERGIAVASANYRLSKQAPYPAPMLDGARAVQYLREHAAEFGLDGDRIAGCGDSAGAGIALWLGFHTDLARPEAPDPLGRRSSRLSCLAVIGAQTSYDPRFIRSRIGGRAHEHVAIRPFFGLPEDAKLDDPSMAAKYEDASPLTHVAPGAPPVVMAYSEPRKPIPPDAARGWGIHHPEFGVALKERLDPLGVECILLHNDDYGDPEDAVPGELVAFLARHLGR